METFAKDGVLTELRGVLNRIYGSRLSSIRLYGSRARGDATADSDYDVLVILNGMVVPDAERRRCGDAVYDVCWRNDAVVMCHFVSRDRFEREKSPFIMNVQREGVAV